MRVDLPALGRPTTATRIPPSLAAGPSSAPGATSGSESWSSTSSIRPGTPRPWVAETAIGSPSPRAWNSEASNWASPVSDLLTTRVRSLPRRRRPSAMAKSSGAQPSLASTRNRTRSASAMASWTWRCIRASTPWASPLIPPVSTTT